MATYNISARSSIRWLPDPACEPTSTLVLTSPGRHFVDVRVLIKPRGDRPEDCLDWAFAGESTSETLQDGTSQSMWKHWVDSRTVDAESVVDQGIMVNQPDGSSLETGKMVNPSTGVETDYEEVWRDVDAVSTATNEGVRWLVLSMEEAPAEEGTTTTRGKVIRIGQYCQGILRVGDDVAVERWEWKEGEGWKRSFRIGQTGLPCEAILERQHRLKVGEDLVHGTQRWKVIESSDS